MIEEKVGIIKDVIEDIQMHGTIGENYTNGRGCYCAVGWIMKEAGCDLTAFEENDMLNNETVHGLFTTNNTITDVVDTLKNYGFTYEELRDLQDINDDTDDDFDRARAVIEYLEGMLADLK